LRVKPRGVACMSVEYAPQLGNPRDPLVANVPDEPEDAARLQHPTDFRERLLVGEPVERLRTHDGIDRGGGERNIFRRTLAWRPLRGSVGSTGPTLPRRVRSRRQKLRFAGGAAQTCRYRRRGRARPCPGPRPNRCATNHPLRQGNPGDLARIWRPTRRTHRLPSDECPTSLSSPRRISRCNPPRTNPLDDRLERARRDSVAVGFAQSRRVADGI